jgi:long-chain acyl-CoA synthetase
MSVLKNFSTIAEMFDIITEYFSKSDKPAYLYKAGGVYKPMGYNELREMVELTACGLASLGLKKGDKVGLVSENRIEWVISDFAMVTTGIVNVPIYSTLTPRQIEYIFNNAGVRAAFVSNQVQLAKVEKIYDDVKSLDHVIIFSDKGMEAPDYVISLRELMDMGREFKGKNPDYWMRVLKSISSDDLLTLIYTSGTTGDPKGVMLTHKNLTSNIIASAEVIPMGPDDVLLSYLPLSHSFERMAGYYTAFACGGTTAFAESIDTVAQNLLEVRPTLMTSVPRLFERLYNRIMKAVESGPPLRRKIFYWAINVGKRYAEARKRGNVSPILKARYKLADKLVFSKLKARTGGRIKFFVSGGAALSKELGEFFEAMGIKIVEGYGLTETSPVLTVNRLDDYKFGTVGKPIPNVEIKIAPDGEILARGPNIMKGYYNDPKATEETIDKDGWLHTGDIGHFDEDGFLVITDRKKHIFVSSGGKNIAPQPIESLLLRSSYIDQVMVIGERKPFLTALIVPDFEALKGYAQQNNIEFNDEKELIHRDEIYRLFQKEIKRFNKELAQHEHIRNFRLLEKPFTIEDGELTPTLKVKRRVVERKYKDMIEDMYKELGFG